MRHLSVLPLKAVGFGPNRVAARMCFDHIQATLRALPDHQRLCHLLCREIDAEDLDGPTLRFLSAVVDETAEATLMAMGLDEPDMVSVSIDVEAIINLGVHHAEPQALAPHPIAIEKVLTC